MDGRGGQSALGSTGAALEAAGATGAAANEGATAAGGGDEEVAWGDDCEEASAPLPPLLWELARRTASAVLAVASSLAFCSSLSARALRSSCNLASARFASSADFLAAAARSAWSTKRLGGKGEKTIVVLVFDGRARG